MLAGHGFFEGSRSSNSTARIMDREKILEIGKNTIRSEAQTLLRMSEVLDEAFVQAVMAIYQSRGRVVLTGIGKSAVVGQKIVATLNSTGTPALFLHAADAIHGDLGMIRPEDIVLFISKSGSTPEILTLFPIVRSAGNTTIALVSNPHSPLAQDATYAIIIPIDKEAEPNNLAPTSSTTAQMAVGDAISTALSSLSGFSPEDFAKFHPGGTLGKYYHLKAKDFAARHLAPRVSPDTTLHEVILEMTSKRLGATAVLRENHILGIITDGDLRRMLKTHQDIARLTAKDIMTNAPKTIAHTTPAIEVLQALRKYSINQLIVLEERKYVGMVHIHDLINEGLT